MISTLTMAAGKISRMIPPKLPSRHQQLMLISESQEVPLADIKIYRDVGSAGIGASIQKHFEDRLAGTSHIITGSS